MRTLALALWRRLREPRVISAVMGGLYTVLMLGGVAAWIDPPHTFVLEIGETLTRLISVFFIFGGAIGSVSTLMGTWWIERVAVLAIFVGLNIYGALVTFLHFLTPGNRALQLSVIVSLMLTQVVRWMRVTEQPYEPDRSPYLTH